MDRFFCPQLAAETELSLPADEARHVRQVLRKTAGEVVQLFDGRGNWCEAELIRVDKKAVVAATGSLHSDPPVSGGLTIAAAVPKADRFKWMIEKLTELGVASFVPLSTHRGVVAPGAAKLERMHSTVIAACKQSGRNRLMTIDPMSSLEGLQERATDRRLIADVPQAADGAEVAATAGGSTLVAIGPEGGWTPGERDAAIASGFRSVSFGRHVLRTETAAIAAAARLV